MSSYNRTVWQDSSETEITAERLNNMEEGIEQAHNGENVPDFVSYDDAESHETIIEVPSITKGDTLKSILSKITKHIKNLRYVVSSFEEDFEEKCIICLLQSIPSKDGSYYTTPYYFKKKKTVNHVEIIEITVMGEDSAISETARNMFSVFIHDCFICFKMTTETTAVINALTGKNLIFKVLMKKESEVNE